MTVTCTKNIHFFVDVLLFVIEANIILLLGHHRFSSQHASSRSLTPCKCMSLLMSLCLVAVLQGGFSSIVSVFVN